MKFTICDIRFTRCLLLGKRVAWCVLLFATLNLAPADSQDAEQKKELIGSWAGGKAGEMHFYDNGTFRSKFFQISAVNTKTWSYAGIWEIKDGFCLMTVTNASASGSTNIQSIGSIARAKIVKVDSRSLVWKLDDQTIAFSRN